MTIRHVAKGIIDDRSTALGISQLGRANNQTASYSLSGLAIFSAGVWLFNNRGWLDVQSMLACDVDGFCSEIRIARHSRQIFARQLPVAQKFRLAQLESRTADQYRG